MEQAEYHCQRLAVLRTDRSSFDNQWEEAAARIVPAQRNTFFSQAAGQQQGAKNTELQFDSTASFAAHRFASVMESLVTPQNSVWHLLKAVDPALKRNRQVRQFFDTLSEVLFQYRYRPVANFVGNSQQVYLGLGVYGNGVMFIDQPDKQRGLRYRSIHIGETYFVENHAGVVDTLYRAFRLTIRQLAQKYGEDKLPQSLRDAMKDAKRLDEYQEVLHVVLPREDYDAERVDSKGMPFASLVYLVKDKTLLSESGFRSFPYAVTRYTQAPGETYGRGPAQMVLPAIKVLNEEKKTMLKQGHRITDPVLLAHDDGQLGSFSLKAGALNAGGVNKDGKVLVHALPTGNLAITDKLMDMERSAINDAFLVALFQILVDNPQMTATEVLERTREKGMLLAPTAGRQQAEFLGPMIGREIDLLVAQGLMPPMPPILQQAEAEYRIEYDNLMSRMIRAEPVTGFMRVFGMFADYAKATGDMGPLDWLDTDTAAPEIADAQGVPTRWTRTQAAVDARRADRQKAAEQQQMVDAAPAMASVASSVGKGAPA